MTLGNMRALGVQRIIASCLNDACGGLSGTPQLEALARILGSKDGDNE
jgi:hypothetical protein